MQSKVKKLIEKYGLFVGVGPRYIDLVSETGELGKEILKSCDYDRAEFNATESFEEELGDCLFSLLALADAAEIDADTALDRVLVKYERRFAAKGDVGSGR